MLTGLLFALAVQLAQWECTRDNVDQVCCRMTCEVVHEGRITDAESDRFFDLCLANLLHCNEFLFYQYRNTSCDCSKW